MNTIIALEYGLKLIGIPYDYWIGGKNQEKAPMFAINGPSPDSKEITSLNCAGLVNLLLRFRSKELPYDENNNIGGTESYYYYYKDKALKFDINKKYPIGSLLIRKYRNINDQGHLAIILEDNGKDSLLLQSHVEGEYFKSKNPGVNSMYTLEQSHNLDFFELVVLPIDWIE
tara:strand:- start:65 stop:580 length:516 start_codon:yes stop_codon:yes gene_type:complete